MIVFRAVKHDRSALESIRINRIREVAIAELFGNDTGFHNGIVEKVALQDEETSRFPQRLVNRIDHPFIKNFCFSAVFTHRFAIHGDDFLVNKLLFHQFVHNSGNPACAVVFFTEVFAGGLQVDQQGNVVPEGLPVIDAEFDADMAGNRIDVNGGIGRTTDR